MKSVQQFCVYLTPHVLEYSFIFFVPFTNTVTRNVNTNPAKINVTLMAVLHDLQSPSTSAAIFH